LSLCVSASSLSAQTSSSAAPASLQQQTQEQQTQEQQTQGSKPAASSTTANTPLDSSAIPPSNPDAEPVPPQVTVPDFAIANSIPPNSLPMTADQKYIYALHQAFDPSAHAVNVFRSAFEQAANGQPHYGEGWGAYEKRFAAGELDQITGSALIYGFLPTVLHEDPRYFRRGSGSAMARVWYAVNRIFVTQRDNGTSGFNNSRVFGQLISCGISTSYYPARDRTVGYMSENWGVNLGASSAFNVFYEFYPDLKRHFFHSHKSPSGN